MPWQLDDPLGIWKDEQTEGCGVGGTAGWGGQCHELVFPLAQSCTCHNRWLHQALTWIKRVIFHWWTTCWLHVTQNFSCNPYLLFTLSESLFVSAALYYCFGLLFLMIYGEGTRPRLHLTPGDECRVLTSCFSQEPKKTLSNMVPLTNVFYLFTINNLDVQHVSGVMPHIHTNLVVWEARRLFELDIHWGRSSRPQQ